MARLDPYKPHVIGSQFAPLVDDVINLDTGTEIGFTFDCIDPLATSDAVWARVFTTVPPPGQPENAEIIAKLYLGNDPTERRTPNKKITIPVSSGYRGTGATLYGGATTEQGACASPSDQQGIAMAGASSYVRLWFDTTAAAVTQALNDYPVQIVDVSVRYVISGPFDTSPTETMMLSLESPSIPKIYNMDDNVGGPALPTSNVEIRRSRLGELNPFYCDTFNPGTSKMRGPWTYSSIDGSGLVTLSASGAGMLNIRIETNAAAAGTYYLQYAALEVTYCEQGALLAAGGCNIWQGSEVVEGIHAYTIPLMAIPNMWSLVYASTVAMDLGQRYTLTISRAYTGYLAVAYPVPVPVSVINTVVDTIPDLYGVRISKPTTDGALPSFEVVTSMPAICLYDADPFDETTCIPAASLLSPQGYVQQLSARVTGDTGFTTEIFADQALIDDVAATFSWAIFYAQANSRIDGKLYINQTDAGGTPLGPVGSITPADFAALPEIVDGWKRVIVELSPPAVLAAGGVSYWRWSSGSSEQRFWYVLGATANPKITTSGNSSGSVPGYGSELAFATLDSNTNYPADITLAIAQDMQDVTDFSVAQMIQDLATTLDPCGLDTSCIPTGIVYNHLSWTATLGTMVSGWAYYEIQRQDDTMLPTEWETIAKITTPYATTMDDYEARIDAITLYRIRTVHVTGVAGAWSATITSTIVAPGVIGSNVDVGVMVFTSNDDPSQNLAYVHVSDRDPQEDFDFLESGRQSFATMFGRDFQIALRPSERSGVAFERSILVNLVAIPVETLSHGFRSLRDMAWGVRPYVCVRDELANRWLASVQVPSGSTRRLDRGARHLQIAKIRITEVTDVPSPIDVARPWLGVYSTDTIARRISATPPASFLGMEDFDIRIKLIPTASDFDVSFSLDDYVVSGSILFFVVTSIETKLYLYSGAGPGWIASTIISPIINQPIWIRVLHDHDVGAGDATSWFYTSSDGVAWTLVATVTDAQSGFAPFDTGTLDVYYIRSAIVQQVVVINSATATTIVSPNLEIQSEATTTFIDGQANTWTISEA